MQTAFIEKILATLDQYQQLLASPASHPELSAHLASDWLALTSEAGELDCQGLADLLVFFAELQAGYLDQYPKLAAAETEFLAQGAGQLSRYLLSCSTTDLENLLIWLQSPKWPDPVAKEDIAYLRDLLVMDGQALATEALEVGQDDLDLEDDGNFCPINPRLLSQEAVHVEAGLAAMVGDQCLLMIPLWQGEADLPEALEKTLAALQPVIKVVTGLNLWGAQRVLAGLAKNLKCYQDDPELMGEDSPTLVAQGLAGIGQYLHNLGNPDAIAFVLGLFASPEWPYCLDETQAEFLAGLLLKAKPNQGDLAAKETLTLLDVDLSVPEDVDARLLDMVYTDLPLQTEEFAKTLNQFLSSQDREALRTAQRVAHTVKGLANMLGIKGLANLTHKLEDLLEWLYTHQQNPDRGLADTLIEASDCLAIMTETLLGRTNEPNDALTVLQSLADGFYQLRTGQLPAAESSATALAASAQEEPAKAVVETANREDAYVRVPKALLDNMFRIAGEVKVLDAQLDAQIKEVRAILKRGGERYHLLQRIIAELEHMLGNQFHDTAANKSADVFGRFDSLEMNRLNEMHSTISRLYESVADTREIERTVEASTRQMHSLVINLVHLHKDNLDNILGTRLLAADTLVPRLQRTLRQACRVAGKEAELQVSGAETLIDSQILNQLADPLMHIIRNAVDHGLEAPEKRALAGKPELGTIRLAFAEQADLIVVTCEDDGGGINRAAIRQIALNKGLIDPDTPLSDEDVDRLILVPGFSTKEAVSQLSGRGIGMDVVNQEIIRLKGKLGIASVPGQGCRFTLSMPSSALLLKASLAQAGPYTLSIIQYGIDKVLLAGDGALQPVGVGWEFVHQDQSYKAYTLESLVEVAEPDYTQLSAYHVLMVSLGHGEKVAVMAAGLQDNRELVFKDLGAYVPHNPVMPGVTLLANGQVSPVLDLPEALKQKSIYNQRVKEYVAQTVVKKLPKILVVDDSLSARKSLATLLKDSGYEVATAIDGQDALEQIDIALPDLVVTDMEMPRVNGIELTATIKQRRRSAKVPVLMVTSRSTDKHRKEAAIVGVDAYLTKPWSETELLQKIETLL